MQSESNENPSPQELLAEQADLSARRREAPRPPAPFSITGDVPKLAVALAKAQSEFRPIERTKTSKVRGTTKTGSQYEYEFDYAPLDEVKAKTQPALNANGFAVLEPFCEIGQGLYELRLLLLHEAGQIETKVRITHPGDVQKLGSQLTYLRRYLYTSTLGVTAETDDDGNAADGNQAQIQERRPQQARPEPRKAPPPEVAKQAQNRARESKPEGKPEAEQRPGGPGCSSETFAAIMAEAARLKLKGPHLADSAKTVIGCTPDRLELEGGEALAQTWLKHLQELSAP